MLRGEQLTETIRALVRIGFTVDVAPGDNFKVKSPETGRTYIIRRVDLPKVLARHTA